VPIAFPSTALLDARSLEDRGRRAAFVTSGMLDAIELFARTVSCCARLNQQALSDLAEIEERPPEHVALAWMPVRGDRLPGLTISELLEVDRNPDALRALLFSMADFAAGRLQPGIARHHLAHYLTQMMLRVIRRATHHGWDPAYSHGQRHRVAPSPIDARFLELITLSFVALHELGHIALGHNGIGYRGTETELALSELFSTRLRDADGVESFVDFVGTQSSFELAADVFAVQVVAESLREPLLEAATLWCAANERAHFISGDRIGDLQHMSRSPQKHPSPAVRVWYLNGRLSSGRRAGPIARLIAAAAESAGYELQRGQGRADPGRELALFAALWDLIEPAAAEDTSLWTPPRATDKEEARRTPHQQALERGLHAWEAGEFKQAEESFRLVVHAADGRLAAKAHGLIGRMLEEQGDARAAEAEYRVADDMGDGDAANDLGTLLQDRGHLADAMAAFARADARDNAPGAFNLGLIAEQQHDRAAALAAFRRADQRGHPQAALNLGILKYHAGQLEEAEAALRRAEARGANNAATYLGIALRDRGDMGSAEAAWRRGAMRGELDAWHSLGCLLEEQGRLQEAHHAFTQAVLHGRHSSFGNLRAIQNRLEGSDGSTTLRAAADSGDANAAYELGVVLVLRGEHAAALEAWNRAEELGHARASNEIGLVLHRQGELAGAEAAYRRGAQRGHPRAIYNLGVLLHERGDEDGAQAAWAEADRLGDPLAATNVGSTLEATGALNAALAAYERADARGDALGSVRLGRLLERKDQLEQAEAAYRRADGQGDAYAATALGRLFYERGDLDGAEAAWRRGDLRGNADAALQLGQMLRRHGQLDAAEAAVRRAIERGHPTAGRHLVFLLNEAGYRREAVEALMTPVGDISQRRA
jgi:Tfp pilus assembly protein PilF